MLALGLFDRPPQDLNGHRVYHRVHFDSDHTRTAEDRGSDDQRQRQPAAEPEHGRSLRLECSPARRRWKGGGLAFYSSSITRPEPIFG